MQVGPLCGPALTKRALRRKREWRKLVDERRVWDKKKCVVAIERMNAFL